MISYELAKQLKDAGFPQTFPDGRFYYDTDKELTYACIDHGNVTDSIGIVPTLEEAIETCGDEFWKMFQEQKEDYLRHANLRWCVYGRNGKMTFGSTPLEVVLNLWLAINKSQ